MLRQNHSRDSVVFKMKNTTTLLIFLPDNYVLAVVTSLQIIVGAISNALVIATIVLGQMYDKAPSDIIVLNLSFVDLLPCLTFLPWKTFQLIQGEGFHEDIIFLQGIYFCLRLWGGNAVFAVMLDRYVATCLPLRYRAIVTRKRTFLFTVFFIGCSVLVSDWLNWLLFFLISSTNYFGFIASWTFLRSRLSVWCTGLFWGKSGSSWRK